MLHEPAEGLHRQPLCRAAVKAVMGESVERIKTTNAAGRRVGQRGCEITKRREGSRLARIEQRIQMIRRVASSGALVERGEIEIRQCRPRRARDIGLISANASGGGAPLTPQQPFALDRFGGVQMTADAGRLI